MVDVLSAFEVDLTGKILSDNRRVPRRVLC
jgi:hypothetical protein